MSDPCGMTTAAEITPGYFAAPVDAATVAADWKARGYSCHVFDDPPGQSWDDFVHDTNEVVTVAEGRLALVVEARRFVMEAGDEAFIPRGARHSVINIAGGRTRWLFGYD
ncbi:cupin domain-containing protein [Pelagibius sp.]|uniref:cupin domain-containing protein n=1 Tax=Pelagibius sp. TaxID=1931238 RepID=UPI003BB005AD